MKTLKRKAYEAALEPMQVELAAVARWLKHSGRRLAVLFEGRDTAGKGGAIQAIAEHLNPRQCHVVALPKPSDREAGQWYFQRYVTHLPAAGEITLFDRSWYNRAGVESVMGYAAPEQVDGFLAQVPAFEQQLVDDGILLFKYWLGATRRSRKHASPNACTTRSSAGSCRRSMLPRARAMTITPARATRCCAPRIPRMRRGRWWISTTSAADG